MFRAIFCQSSGAWDWDFYSIWYPVVVVGRETVNGSVATMCTVGIRYMKSYWNIRQQQICKKNESLSNGKPISLYKRGICMAKRLTFAWNQPTCSCHTIFHFFFQTSCAITRLRSVMVWKRWWTVWSWDSDISVWFEPNKESEDSMWAANREMKC